MTTVFCDTETTGLDPINSAPFEIALLVHKEGKQLAEKVFLMNPLNDEVLFHEEAFKVHGVSEETIRSYPLAEEIMPKMAEFLKPFIPEEKLVFGGFKAGFDYGHISASFFRYSGLLMEDYFNGKIIDVLEIVKRAQEKGIIPKTKDQKLTTVAKAFGIPHEEAHSASSDNKAARMLYERIYAIERSKRV